MAERMFGIETEYAFTSMSHKGQIDRNNGIERMIEVAKTRLKHIPGGLGLDLFLCNGSRLYVDSGSHPEFCTPECTNPWDIVRYVLAGEKILGDLVGELSQGPHANDVMLFKCNVDYGGTGNTWGCHESYLYQSIPLRLLSVQIIPHLVSRVIYTGAGGFRVDSNTLEFSLSPRVGHLVREVSGDSTHDRGIFHIKDESLSSKDYHRLHILCGDSLCSHLGTWLKMGVTALVVAMIDAGLRPGDGIRLKSALTAMQTFASDPSCTASVLSAEGNPLTALQIQRHYLEQAETYAGESFMPPWAPEVCRKWRNVLDLLTDAPQSISTCLDWGIKLALFRDWTSRKAGLTWESIPHWSFVLKTLRDALDKTTCQEHRLKLEYVLGSHSPIRPVVKQLESYLDTHGLTWDQFRSFGQLRPELFEVDTRFGQIGPNSIFSEMDHQGVLTHAVSGIDNIEHAVENPPAIGRGNIRGEWIGKLAGNNGRYACSWNQIVDYGQKQSMDLSDPFADQANWEKMDDRIFGMDPAFMDVHFMQLLEMRRHRRARGSNYQPGQSVVVGPNPSEASVELAGRTATIVSVGQDERGVFYRLNVDEGRFLWRQNQLQPVEDTLF